MSQKKLSERVVLHRELNPEISQTEIAMNENVTPSAVSRAIDELFEAGQFDVMTEQELNHRKVRQPESEPPEPEPASDGGEKQSPEPDEWICAECGSRKYWSVRGYLRALTANGASDSQVAKYRKKLVELDADRVCQECGEVT